MLKCHMQLWLLEAVHNDTSTMLTQIHESKSFLTKVTSSSDKGPCSLTHKRAHRVTQIHASKAYMAEVSNKHACCESLEKNAIPQVVVSSGGARHRPAKTKTCIEWTFEQEKETEIRNCE